MAQDYKQLFQLLYEEFGDQIIELAREAVDNRRPHQPNHLNGTDDEVVSDSDENLEDDLREDLEGSSQVNYHDAADFERNFVQQLQVNAVRDSGDVVVALQHLILMAGEVAKFDSAQQTVRVGIAAERDVALAKIEMQKTVLIDYLDKSFDERKENFRRLFTVVDDALEKDNIQQLAMGLDGILRLAETSPFKDLESLESTTSALNDPNHQWDF